MNALRLCAVLLSLFAVAPAFQAPGAGLTPDAELQAALRRLVESSSPDEQRAALQFVAANAGAAHQRLLPQLLLFKEQSQSTREGMLFGALVEQLRIPPQDIVAAFVPLLEGASASRRASIGGVLAEFEDRSIDRGANFDRYARFMADAAPAGLVRYMFEVDADAALLAVARARVQVAAELRDLVWAQHVVADLRWQLRFGFVDAADLPGAASPAALAAAADLAAHSAWWARLAAAQLALEQPNLRAACSIDVLADDAHPLVRETARAAQ